MIIKKHKKLYRNVDQRLLAGVLAGLADYYEHDVTVWRLAFLVLLVLTGLMPGILLYIVGWIIMPPKVSGVYEAQYRVVEESDDTKE